MSADPPSPVTWSDDGQPRSRLYDDVYFSAEDGLAESRAVFQQGCGLPQAWAGRRRFTVGELGFGTGLNIAALLDLWRRERPPGGLLQIFSVEAHPLSAGEAARALAAWPQLAEAAGLLISRWPGRARGFHRIDLPEWGAMLDVAVMDATEALAVWQGRADAWFLDGFSPAVNPDMWRPQVMALLAARSAPGARAATFTVAGSVRRGLTEAGFTVEKKPGFGRKRERLEARLAGAPSPAAGGRVAIIGAGIAGAAAARAIGALGGEPLLFDAQAPGGGASGNPAALVNPRLDAGLGPPARLFAQAFARAVRLYRAVPEAVIARGVLQLATGPRDFARFGKIAASDIFEPDDLAMLDADEASLRLGEPAPAALDLRAALVVEPAAVLAAWAAGARAAHVARLVRHDGTWRLLDFDGQTMGEADAVILAGGLAARDLADGLPLSPVRGQASWVKLDGPMPQAAPWGGYAAPIRGGLLFGATHDREDEGLEIRDGDHARNLATLARMLPGLAARLGEARLEGRAGVRATTPDRLPLAGAAPSGEPGLFVLAGFGSRGFALAPLLAEHVAALTLDAASPLPLDLQPLVDPGRFAERRGRS